MGTTNHQAKLEKTSILQDVTEKGEDISPASEMQGWEKKGTLSICQCGRGAMKGRECIMLKYHVEKIETLSELRPSVRKRQTPTRLLMDHR